MALTSDEEARVRAMLAIFAAQAPSLSADVAAGAAALFADWDGGGHEYAQGDRVRYKGTLYTCLQAHSSQSGWAPGAATSLWAETLAAGDSGTPDAEIPEWVQPGSTNGYAQGARVRHNGKIWESTVDDNVWEPGAVGVRQWTEVTGA